MSKFRVSLKLDANNPEHVSAFNRLLAVIGEADSQTTAIENEKKPSAKRAIKPPTANAPEQNTPGESAYTAEELRGKITKAVDAGVDRTYIRRKINSLGAENVAALKPEFYGEFYTFLHDHIDALG